MTVSIPRMISAPLQPRLCHGSVALRNRQRLAVDLLFRTQRLQALSLIKCWLHWQSLAK